VRKDAVVQSLLDEKVNEDKKKKKRGTQEIVPLQNLYL
jgi:hypothetical protein